mmetsp:Transcript_25295/g.57483  ORF Transcript_25295/g.57483 Transcript_25295/m.57483 type:complete len:230 (+) Transcript_25295:815-1504(+)
MRVPLGGNQLRCKVVRGTACGVCLADHNLGQPHVGKLHMTSLIEQQVLRLEVPEDNLLAVQVLEGIGCPCHVELCTGLVAPETLLVVRCVQLTTQSKLKQEVKGLLAVVCLVELDDEGRVAQQLDVLLTHYALLHARLDHIALAEGFERVHVALRCVLHHFHGAKATATQETKALEIFPNDVPEAFLHRHRLNLLDLCCTVLASLIELVQWPNNHVERSLVHPEGLCRV